MAGTEYESSQEDPAFNFGTESFGTRFLIMLFKRFRPFSLIAVTDAVKSRQVRTRLTGCYQIIRADAVSGMRDGDFLHRCAERLEYFSRSFDRFTYFVIDAFADEFLRKCNLHTAQITINAFKAFRFDTARTCGVFAVGARNVFKDFCIIPDIACNRADLAQ